MMNKKIIILVLFLAVSAAVSGCIKKTEKPAVEDNNQQDIATTTDQKIEYEGELIKKEDGWKKYANKNIGVEFKFKDDNNEVVINSNPNYIVLKKLDIYDVRRGYIYINFFHMMDEEYHTSYKGITYNNLEEYIEHIHKDKDRIKGEGAGEDIVDMKRIKNSNNVSILEVVTQNEEKDGEEKRIKYYLEYNDNIHGTYGSGRDYLLIQHTFNKLSFSDSNLEKEQQLKQFKQIIDNFKFID